MPIIREAVEKDIPHILELYHQLSLEPAQFKAPPPDEARQVFRRMSDYPDFHLLVADDNGKVIGTTVLAVLPGLAHGAAPFAVIEYVVVDEPYRGRGIGRLMMDSAKSLAKGAGCYKIMLTSDRRRERAHRFYQKIGFEDSAAGFRIYL